MLALSDLFALRSYANLIASGPRVVIPTGD